ncbi:MAG: HlyD family secretion protein [Prevotellaceae bacterium]|jgi:multidrug resistance efflux pump|nr:HlyD family secretion protein [Prevotellaceae bacterium]
MDSNNQFKEKNQSLLIELHHREVTELLGDPPKWLIHSGSYLLYVVLVFLLLGASFISYPEVVRGSATIEDLANAEWITVNTSGQIETVFVVNDSLLQRGDTIAILQNPAYLKDVRAFIKILSNVEKYYQTNNTDLLVDYRFDFIMGEMAGAYENFTNAVRNCMIYDEFNHFSRRNLFLQNELAILKRDQVKNELAILRVERDVFELSITHQTEKEKNKKQLELTYEGMVNAIRTWESKYLIKSNSNGRIVLGDERSLPTRMVNKGDTIASVISNNKGEYVARMYLNQVQIAGVETGNFVSIRLAKYPDHTYGLLIGEVSAIAYVPYSKQYVVEVRFPDQLVTTAKKEIRYELGLKGDAKIVTSNRSVLSRVFNPIYALFRNSKNSINNYKS